MKLKLTAKIIFYLVKRRVNRWLLRRSWRKEPAEINGPMGTVGKCLLAFLLMYGMGMWVLAFYQMSGSWYFWWTY